MDRSALTLKGIAPRIAATVSCILCLSSILPTSVLADTEDSREYKIKAAYLYNLIKFVNWPSESSNEQAEPTHICIYRDNPFDHQLDKLLSRQAKGRPITVSYVTDREQLDPCNILFVAQSNGETDQLLQTISDLPLLTVGENKVFLDSGGIIGLIVQSNSVQLQINLSRAKALGFEISGNLLEIAKAVQ